MTIHEATCSLWVFWVRLDSRFTHSRHTWHAHKPNQRHVLADQQKQRALQRSERQNWTDQLLPGAVYLPYFQVMKACRKGMLNLQNSLTISGPQQQRTSSKDKAGHPQAHQALPHC